MSTSSLHRVGLLQAMRHLPQLLKRPIPFLRRHLEIGGGIFETYLGARKICVTDLPDAAVHILQKNHRNFRKPPRTYGALAEFLGNGLLTSEGERWRTHRKLIQPGFHPQRIARLAGVMADETNVTLDRIAAKRGPLDWAAESVDLTARIIGRTLFSDQLSDEEFQSARRAISRAERMVVTQVRSPVAAAFSRLTGRKRRILREVREIRSVLLDHVSQRKKSGRTFDDLTQMLLDARFEKTGEGLPPEDLIDEALTFYVAGHETSSHGLSWFVYETGQRPELQNRLREEVGSAARGSGRGAEDLGAMPLLRSTLKETLRLHPPALDRRPGAGGVRHDRRP